MQLLRTRRFVLLVIVALAAGTLVAGYVHAEYSAEHISGDKSVERAFQTGERGPVVGERKGITVVATDSNAVVSDEGDGPRARAELVAFAPNGSIYYYDDTHNRYWDVDQVPGTRATVEYLYSDHLSKSECHAKTVCTRNGMERVNLTTGEREQVFSRITPYKHSTRWHDADRIDGRRVVVADIYQDRVFVVDTKTDLVGWSWEAQSEYPIAGGGSFPDDWTHLNDVELVEFGGHKGVMVSLRNQDSVVFIDFERGLLEKWTLGSNNDHSTLFEQHNPDYIPPEQGGPAVVVADSENRRLVEYRRVNGEWKQTWTWQDDQLQWPRDADRLPNGNTLVADSNGDRVLEVDRDGDVVWSASVSFPYEVERLGTGDESAGGPAAHRADLRSRTSATDPRRDPVKDTWRSVLAALPPKVVNSIVYVYPRWMGLVEVLASVVLVVALGLLAVTEWRRADVDVTVRSPFEFRRR